MMTDQTVYVVEDDPEMRQSVCHVLASVSVPVETYADAEEFLEGEDGGRAGCLVTDVCLPGMSGFDLQRALARLQVQLPIIMITGYGDVRTAVRAMKAGAVDFIEKPFSGQLLLDSVAQAFKLNDQAISAQAQRVQLHQRSAALTRRERQVMTLVIAGRTNKHIAAELVNSYVMAKMKAGSLAELVRFAGVLERWAS